MSLVSRTLLLFIIREYFEFDSLIKIQFHKRKYTCQTRKEKTRVKYKKTCIIKIRKTRNKVSTHVRRVHPLRSRTVKKRTVI